MQKNDIWLAHSDLFNDWIIESKSWVRSLGWFEDFSYLVKNSNGWVQLGDRELTTLEYIDIINPTGSEKKIYWFNENESIEWKHINIPIVFVFVKDTNSFVVGWAGPKNLIEQYKKESEDPWDWPDKFIVETDPVITLYIDPEKLITKPKIPVFFVSNGESNAEKNWERLVKLIPSAMRIDGINGRRKMFHRCADLCGNSKQFFLVTGKNFITDKSVFNFPVEDFVGKHIVFHAKNMSNRLEYGHMGVVCYDKELVLNTPEQFGLDFTGYSLTELIPRTVSEATFSITPFEAWRTSFRECVKLTLCTTEDCKYWLACWLSFAEGDNSYWVLKGAKDGHEFALEHKNDKVELRNSENWEWLKDNFEEKYGQ